MENTRYAIIGSVLALMFLGTVAVYSAAASLYGVEEGLLNIARRQIMWVPISAIVMFVFSGIDYHLLRRHAGLILIISIISLVAVHVIGTPIKGAQRWIRFAGISVQPSEFFKIAIVLYMARFLSDKERRIREFAHGIVAPVLITGLGCILIVMQPDFGNALMTAIVVGGMLFVAGVNLLHALPLVAMVAPLVVYMVVVVPYRMRRILTFLDPWADPHGAGYQIIQSTIAFGSGGILGVGPGSGMQKSGYTPETITDFILSLIGEEFGFLGTAGIVLLCVVLLIAGMRVVRQSVDTFGSLLGFGLLLSVALQAVINIGVVTGMLPTKGLPLPFVSAGGSSMIAMAAGIGIILNIASHIDEREPVRLLGAERVAV